MIIVMMFLGNSYFDMVIFHLCYSVGTVYVYVYLYLYVHVYLCLCLFLCLCLCFCYVYVYVMLYVWLCLCSCLCLWFYIQCTAWNHPVIKIPDSFVRFYGFCIQLRSKETFWFYNGQGISIIWTHCLCLCKQKWDHGVLDPYLNLNVWIIYLLSLFFFPSSFLPVLSWIFIFIINYFPIKGAWKCYDL